jgi:hypothetical protein
MLTVDPVAPSRYKGRGGDHRHQIKEQVTERVELYGYHRYGRSWPVVE